MTRNPASAKKAGTAFETAIADHLREHVNDSIERRARNGNRDRGDIAGVTITHPQLGRQRVVIEAKNTARTNLAGWTREAHTEAANDGALVGVVISKRHGNATPGDQWVHMTVDDLVALLTGVRPGGTL